MLSAVQFMEKLVCLQPSCFFLDHCSVGKQSKGCGQGFKNKQVTARVQLATCKVLPVTLVKIITFWPLMNFLKSPTFVKSGTYLKTV